MRPLPKVISAGAPGRDLLDRARPTPSGLPIIRGWFSRLQLRVMRKSVVNGRVQELPNVLSATGVVMAIGHRELKMMPEGQRSWKHKILYTDQPNLLSPDDVVTYQGTTYRVMDAPMDRDYGVSMYLLIADYVNV